MPKLIDILERGPGPNLWSVTIYILVSILGGLGFLAMIGVVYGLLLMVGGQS